MRAVGSFVVSLALVVTVIPVAHPQVAAAASCDSAGTPTTTVYLPNITKTLGGPTGWVTPFIVQSIGVYPTTLEVSFYRFSDGALVACRQIPWLMPGSSYADVPNNDTDLPGNSQFSVVVRSFGSEVVSVVNEHAGSGDRAEALSYVGLTEGARRVALPYVAKFADGWLTTIVVQNLGRSDTLVTASFASLDGSRTATLTRAIGPGRSKFIDPTFESSLSTGTEYSVVLTASQPIAAVVNAHNDAATVRAPMGFSYNGVAVGEEAPTYVPLVARNADGVGRTSRVIVQNAGTGSARPTLTLRRLGSSSPVTVRAPQALDGGHAWSLDLGDTAGVSDGEHALEVSSGSFAVLNVALTSSTAMGYTGSPASRSRLYLPNVTRTLGGSAGWTTPILVQSAGATAAALRWYRLSDGKLMRHQTVSGLVTGSTVRIDPRTVSGLADDTQYAVILDARGPVNAIVEETSTGRGDTRMAYEGFAGIAYPFAEPTVVSVTPDPTSLIFGTTQQFTARVTDQFGDPASATVAWSVSPPELGRISSTGLFTPTGYGSGKVSAESGVVSDEVTVTVRPAFVAPPSVQTSLGPSYLTVDTARGTFGVYLIKERLSDVTVTTTTANSVDCSNDCPVKPLADHIAERGAFAGMNGTYLCPPDYAWCAGKVNSYDYAVYDSFERAWSNSYHLVSPTNGLVTFVGDTVRFYRHTYSYDRSAVTAAISNFPILLLGGMVVDTEAEQADYQKQRGTKGSIGTDGTHVFLALVTGASVTDSAYVLQALGIRDALNLDGGGTSAMYYDGAYRVGPGRLLPNAVLLTRP